MPGYLCYSHQVRWVRKIFTIRVIACVVALRVVRLRLLFQSKRECRQNEKAGRRRAPVQLIVGLRRG